MSPSSPGSGEDPDDGRDPKKLSPGASCLSGSRFTPCFSPRSPGGPKVDSAVVAGSSGNLIAHMMCG